MLLLASTGVNGAGAGQSQARPSRVANPGWSNRRQEAGKQASRTDQHKHKHKPAAQVDDRTTTLIHPTSDLIDTPLPSIANRKYKEP